MALVKVKALAERNIAGVGIKKRGEIFEVEEKQAKELAAQKNWFVIVKAEPRR